MQILTVPVGPLQANCYIVQVDKESCIIIDPGDEDERIVEIIDDANLKPLFILGTHGHDDHVGAVDAIREHYNIPFYLFEEDEGWLNDPRYNLGFGESLNLKAPDRYLNDEERIEAGDFMIEVLHTPGHSKGSACFYIKEMNVCFTGDTLFYGSIGRTDFFEGDYSEIIASIAHRLKSLSDEVILLPGHGPKTEMGFERKNNPYIRMV